MGLKPSHRNTEELQPEVCALTGRLVPVADLVVSEVEGLRGYAISSIAPFAAKARINPSYLDYRQFSDNVHLVIDDTVDVPGTGQIWWVDTRIIVTDDDYGIADDDGDYIAWD
jgi:hypothetical protein